jgi:hypothetical protein
MATAQTGNDKSAVRPFRVEVPEEELNELRRRIKATKWPERETVTDSSEGVPLATIQELAATGGPITTGAGARRS